MQQILTRYGWRTPFVVALLAWQRLSVIRDAWSWTILSLTTHGHKGRRIRFGPQLYVTPGADFELGDDVWIGARCYFEIGTNPPARLSVGPDTWISHDCHISSSRAVRVGAHVLIGEFVSIRDGMHSAQDLERPMKHQPDILGTITIEDDVWIGRGAVILGRPEGVVLGHGSIVGANSVVSHSVPARTIVAGAPARTIRTRQAPAQDARP